MQNHRDEDGRGSAAQPALDELVANVLDAAPDERVRVLSELDNADGAQRCASQLRSGFQGSAELAQLEEQQRSNGR